MPPIRTRTHYDTSQKAKVQGAYQFLVARGISFDPRDIFRQFDIRSDRQGYKIIRDGASSRTRHNSELIETRGRKSKITSEQVREADHILQDESLQLKGKRYT